MQLPHAAGVALRHIPCGTVIQPELFTAAQTVTFYFSRREGPGANILAQVITVRLLLHIPSQSKIEGHTWGGGERRGDVHVGEEQEY